MSQLSISYMSRCLIRPIEFKVILPGDYKGEETEYTKRPRKTIMLLHGYTGAAGNWIPEYLADKYNFAVVTPSGENGFWLDGLSTGHKYETLISEEIIDYIRRNLNLALTPENTYIMGMSMGGFGALHTALAHPDVYGTAIGLSSALIVHGISGMKPGTENPVANYEYYRECFGDLETVLERSCNPEVLVKNILAKKEKMPKIVMACGTEDFLLENNREFHKFLESNGVEHTYCEWSGSHDMKFWDECVKKFIPEIFGQV